MSILWKLKGCTRCGGDLFLGSDGCGPFVHCFQCGDLKDLPARQPLLRLMPGRKVKQRIIDEVRSFSHG